MNPLSPPPAAKNARQAVELVRAWIIDTGLHCSLNIGTFGEQETAAWGILLSDIARHVADAIEKSQGTPHEDALRNIAQSFNFEMKTPTAPTAGSFTDKQ